MDEEYAKIQQQRMQQMQRGQEKVKDHTRNLSEFYTK